MDDFIRTKISYLDVKSGDIICFDDDKSQIYHVAQAKIDYIYGSDEELKNDIKLFVNLGRKYFGKKSGIALMTIPIYKNDTIYKISF